MSPQCGRISSKTTSLSIRFFAGDRISSVKISFRNMVYEDALTILSYASPYDVELEVENGGSGSKPTTLLKKSVGPNPTRICHPLYRSQSIPELSQAHKSVAKRLFIADPNESVSSNYSTTNSTLKSSKSTPGGGQSLERRHEETKNNHYKFGIKVLPALDGTVHRIENQNEHNTNLERRHSRKIDAEKLLSGNRHSATPCDPAANERKTCNERLQQRADNTATITTDVRSIDMPEKADKSIDEGSLNIPSEVPTEVHNAAMAARRNRKSTSEPLQSAHKTTAELSEGAKSPQKNKRKAPAPPKNAGDVATPSARKEAIDTIDSIADYTDSLCDYVSKARENTDTAAADARRHRLECQSTVNRRNSESDTDSEMQNSFTTIELNPSDITIHRTPVPETNDDGDEDDMYRKAASLGDLSKYENKTATTLERAQSLDMGAETNAKKRKAPLPPDDINESTEDLTKLDQIDAFDRRKLKKSNEWGTLEDVIWSEAATDAVADEKTRGKARTRKRSNGTLERSKSAVEIKLKEEAVSAIVDDAPEKKKMKSDDEVITSIELYNLPLSKRLTQEFIHTERMFNPDEDNSLARIVNDGRIVKSPTPEQVELNFQLMDEKRQRRAGNDVENSTPEKSEDFSRALRYFELHASASPATTPDPKVNLTRLDEWREEKAANDASLYAGKQPVVEEPILKMTIDRGHGCRGCEDRCGQHSADCEREKRSASGQQRGHSVATVRSHSENAERETDRTSTPTQVRVYTSKSEPARYNTNPNDKSQDSKEELAETKNDSGFSTFHAHRTKFEQRATTEEQRDRYSPMKSPKSSIDSSLETHFARRVINVTSPDEDDDEEDEYEFGSGVRANSKSPSSPKEDGHNISSVSISSGENSEDSGLVRESMDYNNSQDSQENNRPSLPDTPVPNVTQKLTYITEIKVSPKGEAGIHGTNENEEATTGSNRECPRQLAHEIKVTSNGRPTSGKKPPVPPRRSDITKSPRDDHADKQVVYVSEYKSNTGKSAQILDAHSPEAKQSENKKFEQWIFVADKEQNRWSAAPAGQTQPKQTNVILSSRDDTN